MPFIYNDFCTDHCLFDFKIINGTCTEVTVCPSTYPLEYNQFCLEHCFENTF